MNKSAVPLVLVTLHTRDVQQGRGVFADQRNASLTSVKLIQSPSARPTDASVSVSTATPWMPNAVKVDAGEESNSPTTSPLIVACETQTNKHTSKRVTINVSVSKRYLVQGTISFFSGGIQKRLTPLRKRLKNDRPTNITAHSFFKCHTFIWLRSSPPLQNYSFLR